MQRALVALGTFLAGCSFQSASLPIFGDDIDAPSPFPPDSPVVVAIDGPVAAIDAPVPLPDSPPPLPDSPLPLPDSPLPRPDAALPRPDAAVPRPDAARPKPDAPSGPCPVTPTPLELGQPIMGTLSGASLYAPSCSTEASGGEDFYTADVDTGDGTDLVFDVEATGNADAVLDVTATCHGPSETCAAIGRPGAGEVVVIPHAVTGRIYPVVDSVAGHGGSYTLLAFVRSVVGKRQTCDPTLIASRCTLGNYCLDLNNDGTALCETVGPLVSHNGGGLEAGCASAILASDDTVILGALGTTDQVDVVALDPPKTGHVRIAVSDGDGLGGCSADSLLEVFGGEQCVSAATTVATDDNSGLGPCPRLDSVPVTKGVRLWVHLRLADGATLPPSATYTMVVDYF